MKKAVLLAAVLSLAQLAWGLGVSGGFDLGFVSMDFLNGELEALAAREGVTFTPLRLSLSTEGTLWPWPWLGVGLEWLSSSGGVHGREELVLSAQGLGLSFYLGWEFGLAGLLIPIESGLGGYWLSTSGLVEGWSLGLGGKLSLGLVLLRMVGIEVRIEFGTRFLQAGSLHTGRETITPGDRPALDFSGLFLGVKVGWR